jgi:hypothetical protein
VTGNTQNACPAPARRRAYLRGLAQRDWGTPAGFGGRTCFQAIPPLELERCGEAPGVFRWEWIDYSLELLRRRRDCQDFAMVGLLRMLCRYADSALLTGERRAAIRAALLGAKFAEQDPGEDTCCWHTENHQVQYRSSEFLAGQLFAEATFSVTGRTGAWHRDRARGYLMRWLDWRTRFSFSEWNSSCYYDEDAAALLNLAEFAGDAELRRQALEVLQLLALHVALNSLHGIPGGSQGRAYIEQQIAPGLSPMATLAHLCWSDAVPPPSRLDLAAVSLAAGDVSVHPAVAAIGRADPDELENRERHGLDAAEGAAFDVHPDRQENYLFFAGAGQEHHPLVVEARYRHHGGHEKWPGFFCDRDYYARCRERGEPFDAEALPHAMGHADLYTFRTPDYMLGCAQDYRPGRPGYQQFIWCATLGPHTTVFSTNPAPADVPYGRPGPWVGNGVLPKAVQHRNVLICLHRVRPCPIYDQPPWFREDRIHAWFPRGAFDELIEDGGWCCARKGDAYVGLRPVGAAAWATPDPAMSARLGNSQPYEWVIDGTDGAWICELGAARSHGAFAAFARGLAQARVEGDTTALRYDSPSLGRVETGWERGLTVNGRVIAIHDYPRFANPYCEAPFGARRFEIRCAGHTLAKEP